jgi:hypothetical protein
MKKNLLQRILKKQMNGEPLVLSAYAASFLRPVHNEEGIL